jgi:shikimate 5-dehydrogenase
VREGLLEPLLLRQRAKKLNDQIGCDGCGTLEELPKDYDILVNCTSSSMPISSEKIIPGRIVMDVNHFPRVTLFLQEAFKRESRIILGEELFVNQAARQSIFWMKK